MNRFISNKTFWRWSLITALLCSLFFAWELGIFPSLPSPPRPPASTNEIYYTIALIVLLAFNAGLLGWRKTNGTCPVSSKRATKIGGVVGAAALLCPVCLLVPISLFGISISFAVLGPFLPLLQTVALVLLVANAWILLTKNT